MVYTALQVLEVQAEEVTCFPPLPPPGTAATVEARSAKIAVENFILLDVVLMNDSSEVNSECIE